jgi:hypothetical protein
MELLQLTTSGISLAHSITENTMPSDTLKKKTEWTESPGIPGILYKLVGG